MISRSVLALTFFILTGCATVSPSIPENYTGLQARIDDSTLVHSGSKADMFVAEQLNGKDIDNSIRRSLQASSGRGFALTVVQFGRPVVAGEPVKLGVRGKTIYAAPIQALSSTVYQVKGTIEFVPEPNARYVVRGEFGETYSAVWVANAVNNAIVGNKVEVKGSAALSFLEK